MNTKSTVLPLLLLVLVACSDSPSEPSYPDFTGQYVYTGTVNGSPTLSLAGTLVITDQNGDAARVTPTLTLREGGTPVGSIVTVSPPLADLERDGAIEFDFPFDAGGETIQFRHSGRLQGNAIQGNWTMVASDGVEAGNFTAQR